MRLSEAGEIHLIRKIRERFGRKSSVRIGIGDDTAVLKARKENILLTTDLMVEKVHFDLDWVTPYQLGFKLVSVNVSDIYAMGGKPESILVGFAAPPDTEVGVFDRIFDGIADAAGIYEISLVGGDISASSHIVLSGTVTGFAKKIVARSGARAGDMIYVTGNLGDAACGLEFMKRYGSPIEVERNRKISSPHAWKTLKTVLSRHLLPVARNTSRLRSKASSMIDVSDGLLIDLSRICEESGTGAEIYSNHIPVSKEMRKIAAWLGMNPLEVALTGGEDYEILFTAPPGKSVPGFLIGRMTQGGLNLLHPSGELESMEARGYRHFEV